MAQNSEDRIIGGPIAQAAPPDAFGGHASLYLGVGAPAQTTIARNSNNSVDAKTSETINFDGSAVLSASQPNGNLLSAAHKQVSQSFIIPTTGWNWGQLHNVNAVDIANRCGTPIYAAAEGIVVQAEDQGWNFGYGQVIKIEHPSNGTKLYTLYAHLSEILAPNGSNVKQGDLIALMGNTGNTHGPTGCHLHFEVRGADNPLAK